MLLEYKKYFGDLMKAIAFVVAALTFVSCGNKDSEKSKIQIAKNSQTVSGSWCNVTPLYGSYFVSKYSFIDDNEVRKDLIRLTDSEAPVVYSYAEADKFHIKNDTYNPMREYSVEHVTTENEIRALSNLSRQKEIFKEILAKNPSLELNGQEFGPTKALNIYTTGSLFGEGSKDTVYPCSDFSDSFDNVEDKRPIVEFQIFVSQQAFRLQPDAALQEKMSLTYPIKEIAIDLDQLSGGQWCGWMVSGERAHLKILTLEDDFFLINDYFEMLMNDKKYSEELLKRRAEETQKYEVTSRKGTLVGTTKIFDNSPSTNRFVMVKDALGQKALIKAYSENSIVLPNDFFYKCSDLRPLQNYPKYKTWLPKFLELEREQANIHREQHKQ